MLYNALYYLINFKNLPRRPCYPDTPPILVPRPFSQTLFPDSVPRSSSNNNSSQTLVPDPPPRPLPQTLVPDLPRKIFLPRPQ